ncbi:hypothetical protein ACIQKE_00665 [Streptomyces griseoviridis]
MQDTVYVVRHWQAGVQGVPGTLKRTDERVRLHIRPHLGAVSLCDISPAVLRGHIVTLESELSPRYARPILGSLSNVEVWKPALAVVGVIPVRQKGERWKASGKDGFHVAPVHIRLGHPRSGRVRRHPGPLARWPAGPLARWLGHSSPTITLNYHAHFMPEGRKAGGKGRGAIDALLGQPALTA